MEHDESAALQDLLRARSACSYLRRPSYRASAGPSAITGFPVYDMGLHETDQGRVGSTTIRDFHVSGLVFGQLTRRSVFLAFECLIARSLGMKHFSPYVHGKYSYCRGYL